MQGPILLFTTIVLYAALSRISWNFRTGKLLKNKILNNISFNIFPKELAEKVFLVYIFFGVGLAQCADTPFLSKQTNIS